MIENAPSHVTRTVELVGLPRLEQMARIYREHPRELDCFPELSKIDPRSRDRQRLRQAVRWMANPPAE